MAPIKIKVDESLLKDKASLCSMPRNKKRDVTILMEGKELKGMDETCDYQATCSSTGRYCLATLDTTDASGDGYQTLTLRPVAKVYDSWETSVRGYEQQLRGPEGYRAQYKALIEDFASAKKRKMMRSREANRLVEDDDKAKQATDEDATKKPSAAEAATKEWRKSFLPPWNEQSPEPSKVYNFQETAGPALWKWIEQEASSDFDADRCLPSIEILFDERLNESRNPSDLQLSCGVLCAYFSNLFVRLNRKKQIPTLDNDRSTYFGQPATVSERFLSCFTTMAGQNLTMSKANRDSCLVHILLLYLVASHKHAKVDSLRGLTTDLMIDGAEACQLLRQAGCKVVRKNNTYAAAIRTPLTFPAMSRGGRKL